MIVKKVVLIAVIILLLILGYSLSQQIYKSLKAGSRLDEEKERLISLQNKNSELQKKLQEVGTVQFIEGEVRNKLNLARPNETVVVIPQEEIDKILNAKVKKPVETVANWLGWLRLFWK